MIGTSTNLVVAGFMQEAGMEPLGLFEIARVGLPLALAVVAGLVVLTPMLVPERQPASEIVSEAAPDYTVEMVVEPEGRLVGLTVAEGPSAVSKGSTSSSSSGTEPASSPLHRISGWSAMTA